MIIAMFNFHSIYDVISPIFRNRRMARFMELTKLQLPDKIIDVGGYPFVWRDSRIPNQVTTANIYFHPGSAPSPDCGLVKADGTALPFRDKSFEVAFSNSVIEHLGTWQRQVAFAREICRVGRKVWVQTPAKWFPFECHYLAFGVEYLPRAFRRFWIKYFSLWSWLTRPTTAKIDEVLREIRLLSLSEMKELFPGCTILRERFLGLTKSYIAFRS